MKTTALLLIAALPSLSLAQSMPAPAADAPLATSLVPRDGLPAQLSEAPCTPLYQRWQFWTAVGGTVTAVVIGAIAFAALSDHRPAPLTQSQVCGPQGCDACIGLSCR
jgi:hypothetical protein